MNTFFNVNLEFDQYNIHREIINTIENNLKGYVCVVDGNVLAFANQNENYKAIVNGSIINTCDGSSIAFLAGKIHHQKFVTYTGPELFEHYTKQKFKQYFLGNTNNVLGELMVLFEGKGLYMENFKFETLPFLTADEFDYIKISQCINSFSPDIIWVSLGAPKQEIFINKLIPYIDKGLLVAIGAAFNLLIDGNNRNRSPLFLRKLHLEWLYRSILEPKRIGRRAWNYFKLLPLLIVNEYKKINKNK